MYKRRRWRGRTDSPGKPKGEPSCWRPTTPTRIHAAWRRAANVHLKLLKSNTPHPAHTQACWHEGATLLRKKIIDKFARLCWWGTAELRIPELQVSPRYRSIGPNWQQEFHQSRPLDTNRPAEYVVRRTMDSFVSCHRLFGFPPTQNLYVNHIWLLKLSVTPLYSVVLEWWSSCDGF